MERNLSCVCAYAVPAVCVRSSRCLRAKGRSWLGSMQVVSQTHGTPLKIESVNSVFKSERLAASFDLKVQTKSKQSPNKVQRGEGCQASWTVGHDNCDRFTRVRSSCSCTKVPVFPRESQPQRVIEIISSSGETSLGTRRYIDVHPHTGSTRATRSINGHLRSFISRRYVIATGITRGQQQESIVDLHFKMSAISKSIIRKICGRAYFSSRKPIHRLRNWLPLQRSHNNC